MTHVWIEWDLWGVEREASSLTIGGGWSCGVRIVSLEGKEVEVGKVVS
jgi:hypothetical protein